MQNGLLALIRLDLIFEVISGIIALIVTIYATRAYNLTGQKKLSDLSTGFLVLSAGMFGRVIGTWYFIVQYGLEDPSGNLIFSIVTIAYGASRIMAYILFVIATRPARQPVQTENENMGNGLGLMIAATILVDPNLEIIAILVLVVVVIQAIINYMSTRSGLAFFVLLGFFLLLLSHLMVAQTIQNPGMYLSSQLAQLIGFVSLLVMLVRAGRLE